MNRRYQLTASRRKQAGFTMVEGMLVLLLFAI
ncbi:prepilin-type N-terminal cleavage/methylation domain-containing protein, partial [Achromobacter marplatensis]